MFFIPILFYILFLISSVAYPIYLFFGLIFKKDRSIKEVITRTLLYIIFCGMFYFFTPFFLPADVSYFGLPLLVVLVFIIDFIERRKRNKIMPFIIQGKTNWKFLLIIIATLAIITSGLILWWLPKGRPIVQLTNINQESLKDKDINKVDGNSVFVSEEKEDDEDILTFDINFHDYNIETGEILHPEYAELMGDKNLIFSPFYLSPVPPSVKIEKSNGVVFRCKPILMQGFEITISYPLGSALIFSLVDKEEEKLEENPNLALECTYEREYCGPCLKEDIENELFPETPILYDYKKVVDNSEEYTAIITLMRHNPTTNETHILNKAKFKAIISPNSE